MPVFPDLSRGKAGFAPHHSGKMRQTGKAAGGGNGAERLVGVEQQPHGFPDPALDQILIRRDAEIAFRQPRKIVRMKVQRGGYRLFADRFPEMRFYVLHKRI